MNILWNVDFLKEYEEIFLMKLVPLNKVHPQLPFPHQMRPIFATCGNFKVIELRFLKSLLAHINLFLSLQDFRLALCRV